MKYTIYIPMIYRAMAAPFILLQPPAPRVKNHWSTVAGANIPIILMTYLSVVIFFELSHAFLCLFGKLSRHSSPTSAHHVLLQAPLEVKPAPKEVAGSPGGLQPSELITSSPG